MPTVAVVEALVRECREELDIAVAAREVLAVTRNDHIELTLLMA